MVREATLTIGEVAREAGVRTSALRYYESVGLIDPPARRCGRRAYDAGVLDLLRIVRLGRNAGLTLSEIRQLLHGFEPGTPASTRWRGLAERKLRDVTALIERAQGTRRLLEALLSCECRDLADCVRPRLVTLSTRRRASGDA
jgi:MerR family transcriptional regulator, redox-sensitive transcriptional activator SoxR